MRFPRAAIRSLVLAAGLLACAIPARAEDDAAYDVVIEISEQAVTYNGDVVDGLVTLEQDLVADVEADPALTVKVLAHDTVPAEVISQIMEMLRQFEVEYSLEMVSSASGQDDNL